MNAGAIDAAPLEASPPVSLFYWSHKYAGDGQPASCRNYDHAAYVLARSGEPTGHDFEALVSGERAADSR
jgi:hypothetical protein